jgi:hypothetical protein
MGAETKIIVCVLRTHEETIEVYAVTRLEAELEARRIEGVVAVLESWYPENIPNAANEARIASAGSNDGH